MITLPLLPPLPFLPLQGCRYPRDARRRRHGNYKDPRCQEYHDVPSDHLPALQQLNPATKHRLPAAAEAVALYVQCRIASQNHVAANQLCMLYAYLFFQISVLLPNDKCISALLLSILRQIHSLSIDVLMFLLCDDNT